METIFPTAVGFQSLFLVGFRKQPVTPAQTQQVGTVVLKRTYSIDPATGSLTPSGSPLPIFMTDQLDGAEAVTFEHDLAPFKPESDVIVIGFTQNSGLYQVRINGAIWLQRLLLIGGGSALFGWEPRTDSDHPERRPNEAGGYSANAADYPLQWPVVDPSRDPLPGGPGDPRMPVFNNRFYNGYLRTAAQAMPFPPLAAATQIEIRRNGSTAYELQLGNELITARYFYYTGRGADDECAWRVRAFPVNLDTLVIEPDVHRCYTVWRGIWDFTEQPVEAYRRLLVEAN